jgi:hypothetical protein
LLKEVINFIWIGNAEVLNLIEEITDIQDTVLPGTVLENAKFLSTHPVSH